MQEEEIDYSLCQYEVRLKKNKFFGYSERFVYLKGNTMIVCKKPYEKKPSQTIVLQPFWSVQWLRENNSTAQSFEQRTIGFIIYTEPVEGHPVEQTKVCEFYGEKSVFTQLRKYFSRHIFERDFRQDFDIIQRLGKGKYAKVYEIQEKSTKKYFAAKYLNKKKLQAMDFGKGALQNELQVLRMLDHPHCLRLERMYLDDESYYIVTELLSQKKTLYEELQRFESNAIFQYQSIRQITRQLLSAIAHVHSLGVMHRDLKPQNIMFTQVQAPSQSFTHLKVIDFGLAERIDSKRFFYTHVGTPGYVAPEILANESEKHLYSEKCDLFSVGVIFHLLLTGRKFQDVLNLNKRCQISLIGERYENINRDALSLLALMLQPDPELRLSAEEALRHPFFNEQNLFQASSESMQSFNTIDLGPNINALQSRRQLTSSIGEEYQTQWQKIKEREQAQQQIEAVLESLKQPNLIQSGEAEQVQGLYGATAYFLNVVMQKASKRNTNFQAYLDELSPEQKNSFCCANFHDQQASPNKNLFFSALKQLCGGEILQPQEKNVSVNHSDCSTLKSKLSSTAYRLETGLANGSEQVEEGTFKTQRQSDVASTKKKYQLKLVVETPREHEQSKVSSPLNMKESVNQLSLKKSRKSPNSQTNSFHNQIEDFYEQELVNKRKIPRSIKILATYFPKELLSIFLEKSATMKDFSNGVQQLGLFLLFGEAYNVQTGLQQITKRIQQIQQQQIFEYWFVQTVQSMVDHDSNQRANLLQVQQTFNKYAIRNDSSPQQL